MFDQNIIDSMKKECLQEYPMPYFSGLKEEMTDLLEQLKEDYKDVSFHFFLDYGYAICLDNLSRAYYAAVLLGASRTMAYMSYTYRMNIDDNIARCEKDCKELVETFELEGVLPIKNAFDNEEAGDYT